jgi:chemotaxis protein methyltransferase CheR
MAQLRSNRNDTEREFLMRDSEFKMIAKIIYEFAGIVLKDQKKELVYSRLARRIRVLNLPDFASYIDRLKGPHKDEEHGHLINALTTNHTHFFREAHHFDHIGRDAFKAWTERAKKTGNKKLSMWSAGCSTGEEPYTLAMSVAHAFRSQPGWDWKILATDIDTKVLDHAKKGIYKADIAKSVPPEIRTKYLDKIQGDPTHIQIAASLRSRLQLNRLNLLGPWPMKKKFDVIFCRNVMIYFDGPTKEQLVDRFIDMLAPDGFLYLGHSESVLGSKAKIQTIGRTIYMHENRVK